MKFRYEITSSPTGKLERTDVFLVEGDIVAEFEGRVFFQDSDFLLVELANFLNEWRYRYPMSGQERLEYASAYLEASPVLSLTCDGPDLTVESALNPETVTISVDEFEAGVVDFLDRLCGELDELLSIDLQRLLNDALEEKIRFEEKREKNRRKPRSPH